MNEEAKALSLERLKRDLQNLPSKRSLAWLEIQNGVNPRYVAVKYQFPVEQMEAAAEEHRKRQESRQRASNAGRSE